MTAIRDVARVRRRLDMETGVSCRCEGGRSHLEATFRHGVLAELQRRHDARCQVATVSLDPRPFVLDGVEVPALAPGGRP